MSVKKRRRARKVSRREVLQGLGAAIGGAAVGCGGTGESEHPAITHKIDHGTITTTAGSGGSATTSGQGGRGGAGGQGTGGAGAGGGGPVCTGDGGLSPADLLGKIDTVVVLCMENRSFDHFLGSLSLHEGRAVDGLTGAETNPDPNGVPIPIFKLNNFTVSNPPHDWDPVHVQWDGGANDGFVVAHAGPHQQEIMGYHVRDQLPVSYALADAFTVCDRYFCSLLGPTWPNRMYLHGATSHGTKGNTPVVGFTSVFDLLDDAGISHKNYYSDVPWATAAYGKLSGLSGIENFFVDAAAGTLPNFSLIDPGFFGAGANDDHPNHDVKLGQALIASVFAALAQSPQWDRCLFILTYDEHGGFFDHVPPPTTVDELADFAQLGFRVPTIVAGPFARKGCTVSTVLEHCSLLRTLTERFGLGYLNDRVDATEGFWSCIDPSYLNDPQPAPELPMVTVSLAKLRAFTPRHVAQPEMWEMAEKGHVPRELDRRAESLDVIEEVLGHGARLGAVRLV